MPRARNTIDSVQVTISTTPQIRDFLEVLTNRGLHGKNVAETANMLISERIRELIQNGQLRQPADEPQA